MTDRKQLEQAIRLGMARGRAGFTQDDIDRIADAVDALRPEPRPLPEAWLQEVEQWLEGRLSSASQLIRRLLACIRWLEDRFDERGDPNGPDGETAWQRGFAAGAAKERREVLDEIDAHISTLRAYRNNPLSRIRCLQELADNIRRRGPCQPDSLRLLRQETRDLRTGLLEIADDLDEEDALRQRIQALLGGQKQ